MRILPALLLFALSSAAQACPLSAGSVAKQEVYFDLGVTELTPQADAILDYVVTNIDGCRVILVVSAHRDSIEGGEPDGVSQARADAVTKRLREMGVSPLDIVVRDMKSDRPGVPTPPGERNPQNRRVVLTVLSL